MQKKCQTFDVFDIFPFCLLLIFYAVLFLFLLHICSWDFIDSLTAAGLTAAVGVVNN